MAFHYFTGEEVLPGDRVRTGNGCEGVVELVIMPGSPEAEDYQAPDGGVLIREMWGAVPSLLLETPPDGEHWEDLDFLSRGPASPS